MARQYWLMKSEPAEASVDHVLALPNSTIAWFGVRNFQARNYMRDKMRVGDGVLFYHSSCPEPGIAGLAEITSEAYADASQFDPKSKYYDAKATKAAPRWVNVDVQVARKIPLVSLTALRAHKGLEEMLVLKRGNRLSITPVAPEHWKIITEELVAGGAPVNGSEGAEVTEIAVAAEAVKAAKDTGAGSKRKRGGASSEQKRGTRGAAPAEEETRDKDDLDQEVNQTADHAGDQAPASKAKRVRAAPRRGAGKATPTDQTDAKAGAAAVGAAEEAEQGTVGRRRARAA
eukprot:m.258554 g.258554  ORF g.258554 m.258554 type:complete len:288 (-) comp21671_c0_seq1:77-940(-)